MERRADRPIAQLMARDPYTMLTEDSVEKVAAAMDRRHLSAVPVVNADGSAFGIISSFDIAHFRVANRNPKAVRAWELCTYKPVSVGVDAAATDVARLMLKHRFHHVLVTSGAKLCGIVSSFDFVEQYVRERRPAA